jgi:hypothetical protein
MGARRSRNGGEVGVEDEEGGLDGEEGGGGGRKRRGRRTRLNAGHALTSSKTIPYLRWRQPVRRGSSIAFNSVAEM